MIGLDVFSSFLFCSSSSSLDADDGVENDVADESISGLDVGLISVDIWLLVVVNRRTSSYWSSSVFVVVVEWLERRELDFWFTFSTIKFDDYKSNKQTNIGMYRARDQTETLGLDRHRSISTK